MFKDFMILFYTCMYKAQVQGQIILVGGVKYILEKKKKYIYFSTLPPLKFDRAVKRSKVNLLPSFEQTW